VICVDWMRLMRCSINGIVCRGRGEWYDAQQRILGGILRLWDSEREGMHIRR
jgi:hypothetical protein